MFTLDLSTVTWITVSAIATLALAVVTFAMFIRPWFRRPKFSIDPENEGAYSRTAPRDKDAIDCHYLLIKVKNSGKSVARRCVGKIVKVMNDAEEELPRYGTMRLVWANTDSEKIPSDPIDLNRQEYEYLYVAHVPKVAPLQAYFFKDATPTAVSPVIPLGTCIIQITIYGDDVKPVPRKYRLSWGATNHKAIKLEAL
ncbi:MAG: hypothetical protein ISS52_00305 [Dehalococcoidia bacterium]|nr:hypothetical protein [Dehalococcoidia bacterium]